MECKEYLLRKLGKQPPWATETILIAKLQDRSVKWYIPEGDAHKIHGRMWWRAKGTCVVGPSVRNAPFTAKAVRPNQEGCRNTSITSFVQVVDSPSSDLVLAQHNGNKSCKSRTVWL